MSDRAAWSDEELERAMRYGVCAHCGTPRDVNREEIDGHEVVYMTGPVCPNGCDRSSPEAA